MGSITCNTPEETEGLGRRWAQSCVGGEILALRGPLGAGKTQLVKGLAKGVGYLEEVTSPTFTLIHEYEGGRIPLYHFDFYRLENERESVRLGLDDYFFGFGLCVVEWPERVPSLLPAHTQFWDLTVLGETQREISSLTTDFTAFTEGSVAKTC